jgi:hypothetical protein
MNQRRSGSHGELLAETLSFDTELPLPFATQMLTPSNATLFGPLPTATVLMTLPLPGSI